MDLPDYVSTVFGPEDVERVPDQLRQAEVFQRIEWRNPRAAAAIWLVPLHGFELILTKRGDLHSSPRHSGLDGTLLGLDSTLLCWLGLSCEAERLADDWSLIASGLPLLRVRSKSASGAPDRVATQRVRREPTVEERALNDEIRRFEREQRAGRYLPQDRADWDRQNDESR